MIASAIAGIALFVGPGNPVGDQEQVNVYTTGEQAQPAIAMSDEGEVVVVWQSQGSEADADGFGIRARRYSPTGSAQGLPFQVNDWTTGNQTAGRVAVATDGSFVVVWESDGSAGDDSGKSVVARRFGANGAPLGGSFQVNLFTEADQSQPDVGIDAAGAFTVVWASYGSYGDDSDGASIQARRYAANGTYEGGQVQVNTHTTGRQWLPSVARSDGGDFVVAWTSYGANPDPASPTIRMQRFFAEGPPNGVEFVVNSASKGDQYFAAVDANGAGAHVVVWQSSDSQESDSDFSSIQAQRYYSTGVPGGNQFQVNTQTADYQTHPDVGVGAPGDFVVVWTSYGASGDGDEGGIRCQELDPDGPLSTEFGVNSYTTGAQGDAVVAVGPGLDYVVAWTSVGSPGTDSDQSSVQIRRFLGRKTIFLDGFGSGNTDAWLATPGE